MTKDAILTWRIFIGKKEGQAGLNLTMEHTPRVMASPEPHLMQFNAGKAEGWKECLDFVRGLGNYEEDDTPKTDNDIANP